MITPADKPTVLIIDDNIKNIQLAANVLKTDYKILYATSAHQGIELLSRNCVDLILMDAMMPQVDGFEATRLIKQSQEYAELPVVFLTANDDEENLKKAFEEGAVDFIAKPFRPIALKLRVKTQVELYRAKCELRRDLDENVELLRQYRDMLDLSTIVSKSDLSGKITYVNKAFETISGYTKEELLGHPHNILRHPDMPSEVFEKLWSTIQNKELFTAVIKNRHKDGSAYYVRSFIAPILDHEGNIIEYISARQNITHEVKMLESEQQVNQLKDEFLRNMSHEIRTPLNAIVGFSSILARKLDDPKLQGHAQMIEKSARGIYTLMTNLLKLAQLKSGSYVLSLKPVRLKPLIERQMEKYMSEALKKSLDFTYCIDDHLDELMECDPGVVSQVIENLLDNALDFTPEAGEVDVSVSFDTDNKMLKIVIKDSGIGIAKEEQKKINELFYQVDGSITRDHEGMGIGLTIADQLAHYLHGGIVIDSKPDEGARFTVTMKLTH
jgi:PAS domain S-box-containing protein